VRRRLSGRVCAFSSAAVWLMMSQHWLLNGNSSGAQRPGSKNLLQGGDVAAEAAR